MNVRSVEKVNELFKKTLDKTQEFIVEGYCSYGNSKRTDNYRYSSLIDENCKFKIDLNEGNENLMDGVFYVLKVRFYPRNGSNEFRLKVIEVLKKFENKILLNQDYFMVLKNKIDKGYVDIDNYLKDFIKASKKIRLGVVSFKTSVAPKDIFTQIEKEHENLVSTIRYDISIENFEKDFSKIKESENGVDLWAISRGGGDLTFFNSFEVLKEISALNKPILTALGHSTDKTLSDLCSDRYFETPTSLGNYLNQTIKNIYSEEENEKNRYDNYQKLLSEKNTLETRVKVLKNENLKNAKLIQSQEKEKIENKKEMAKLEKLLEERLKKLLKESTENNNNFKKINEKLEQIQNKSSSKFKNLLIFCIIIFVIVIARFI